ncbi:MAG: GIY-YIG nuclease family protein [Oscillospiraceae bacterium]|nr:GIY-YIG nuclease family protein [Oscillospiraceae bacterium]
MNYAYILRCGDKTLYSGWTNDLEKRLKAHNAGKGGKYTRSRLPVELVYFEEFESKSQAMQREYQFKQLSREQKLNLIKKAEA